MRNVVCDNCKKVLDAYKDEYYWINSCNKKDENNESVEKEIDLCLNCFNIILRFMSKPIIDNWKWVQ